MKIFCIDCIWIDVGRVVADERKCSNPYNMKRFVVRNRAYMRDCLELNKDGICVLYKREWYKFWRPKKGDSIIDETKGSGRLGA
jgi:hypothetical protein